MKRAIFLFLFFGFATASLAQLNQDSLWNVWNNESQTDMARTDAMLEIGRNSYLNAHPDSAYYFFQMAYNFSESKGLKSKMALALNLQAVSLIFPGSYEQSIQHFLQSIKIGRELSDTILVARGLYNIGHCYLKLYDNTQAINYNKKSLVLYRELSDTIEVADILYTIGYLFKRQGNYLESIDYYQNSLLTFELINDKEGIRKNLNSLGLVYTEQDDFDKAMEYFEKCLEISTELADKEAISQGLSNIARVYNNKGDASKAMQYYEQSLKIDRELENKKDIAINIYNIGSIYLKKRDFPKALEYYLQGLYLFEEIDEKKFIAMTLGSIGETYFHQNKLQQSISYSARSLHLAEEIGALTEQANASKYLYLGYKQNNQAKEALKHHEHWSVLSDSLNKNETSNKLQLMELNRQRLADSLVMAEEKLSTELAHQKTLDKEKITRNTIFFIGLGILLSSIALIARMRFIRRTNKELAEKNTQIELEKERAEQSEKAKEIFFDNVSHEFRTPLTLIIGPLEEVLDITSDQEVKSRLQIMQRSAMRLSGMINELLDLSKLNFNKLRVEVTEENIVSVVQEYLQSFESLANKNKIKLSFESDAAFYKVWLDVEKFRKILANLLSNACKFTDEGDEIIVGISKQNLTNEDKTGESHSDNISQTGKELIITVSDSGIGISKEKLPHIFDRFYQANEASQAHHAGTGIGLALTKELVELHHGSIRAESKKGEGTTFYISIPLGYNQFSTEEMQTVGVPSTDEQEPEWNIDKKIASATETNEIKDEHELPIILIADDNPDMRLYIKNQLQNDYTIIEAGDGEEGLQQTIEYVPDLVISDVMMPKIDGYVMTEKIKTDQRTNHIPVIILTARGSVDSKIEGLETGADAFLTKPFNARELKVRIRNLIDQRKKLREHFSKTLESLDVKFSSDPNLTSMDQQFFENAKEVVNKYLSDSNFDASTFASEMALSRVQLHRKIKALTNKTTTDFIRTIRLNRAAILLKSHTDNISGISLEVGFGSLSYFAKVFKERFGKTPSEFAEEEY